MRRNLPGPAALFGFLARATLALGLAIAQPAAAQDAPAPAAPHHRGKKAPDPAPPPAAAPAEPEAKERNEAVVEQLKKAGVRTCLPKMIDLGNQSLPGVSGYARAANWQTKTPDDRLASVILGQSYPDGAPLPKAFAMLFGSPSGKAKCDAYSVQVIPTKEKCPAIQTKILIRGKKIGDLSGIPFLNDVNGAQVLLLPSAGDGCVLVGVRIDYAE